MGQAWVRNAWYVAGWAHELGSDAVIARTIIGEPLVLYRQDDGTPVVLQDRCCHRLAPLSMGRREGDNLRCMYHGFKFSPEGRCIEIPGQPKIPPKAVVRRYPAVESGSWLWVWMGDPALADPTQIAPTISLKDPAYRMKAGQLDYDANYILIDDNLLDLSHLSFAHENTLGRGMPQWAQERPRISRLERGLRVERWIQNRATPPYMQQKLGDTFDNFIAYDFLFPGLFLLRAYFYPAGTAQRVNLEAPNEPPLFQRCDDQAVTPVDARRSRYFYAAGARAQDIEWPQVEKMYGITETAFHEDKALIEAQQKMIDRDPEHPMVLATADAAPTQFRRMVQQWLDAEQPTPGAQRIA
jgi:phenylpropionate dioxygenase-like ring-hydroxylating dioxygenase large terminal subunit